MWRQLLLCMYYVLYGDISSMAHSHQNMEQRFCNSTHGQSRLCCSCWTGVRGWMSSSACAECGRYYETLLLMFILLDINITCVRWWTSVYIVPCQIISWWFFCWVSPIGACLTTASSYVWQHYCQAPSQNLALLANLCTGYVFWLTCLKPHTLGEISSILIMT